MLDFFKDVRETVTYKPFRYDPTMTGDEAWKYEGKTIVFGPKVAAMALDGEATSNNSQWRSASGVSANLLREQFPQAVQDAQKYRSNKTT